MTTKWKVLISIVALTTAFAAGRWTTPVKIKTEIKTVTVKEKVKGTEKEIHRETTITETTYPDGRKEVKTVIVEDSTKSTTSKENTNKDKTENQETTYATAKVTISALGGFNLSDPTPVYGASISKPILGPITIGAWGLSNKTLGASLGLTF